jgi:hypothetical protein
MQLRPVAKWHTLKIRQIKKGRYGTVKIVAVVVVEPARRASEFT